MLNLRISRLFSSVHSKICIIGGGSGGLNISAHLLKTFPASDMRIFQPSAIHYYQPAFTMLGSDLVSPHVAVRGTKDVLPRQIPLTPEAVTKIQPEKNLIHTSKGQTFSYEHLVLLAGMQLNWDKIKGAKQAVEDPKSSVTSIYTFDGAEKTRRLGQNFEGGKAIFTEPEPPIKCGGAPQKILYLLTSKWQNKGINFTVQFNKPSDVMFGVPKYSAALAKVAKSYGIDVKFKSKLVEVRSSDKVAVFQRGDKLEEEPFDFLHLVPPMKPPAFIAQSGLGDAQGYVDVNKGTLRHNKYPNIWAAGDNSNLPCSKTAAAIFSQTDVLVEQCFDLLRNMKRVILQGEDTSKSYDGYSCCPIFVGNEKLILAEFKYDNVVSETFFIDQEKPRRTFYHLKKDFFPFAYWNFVPRGIWAGKDGFKTW